MTDTPQNTPPGFWRRNAGLEATIAAIGFGGLASTILIGAPGFGMVLGGVGAGVDKLVGLVLKEAEGEAPGINTDAWEISPGEGQPALRFLKVKAIAAAVAGGGSLLMITVATGGAPLAMALPVCVWGGLIARDTWYRSFTAEGRALYEAPPPRGPGW